MSSEHAPRDDVDTTRADLLRAALQAIEDGLFGDGISDLRTLHALFEQRDDHDAAQRMLFAAAEVESAQAALRRVKFQLARERQQVLAGA